jgi:cytochrome c-type biogenesis protein CcmF
VFILIFLLFVVGGSLTLFALRAPVVKSQVGFNLWSRETLLLGNNLVLVVAASMILLGTLYPLVLDAMTGAKLSVGPPYFNALFIPLMALLMLVMAVGVMVRWKDTPVKWLASMLTPVLLGSAALAVVAGVAYGDFNWAVLATFLLAAWVLLAGVRDIFDKTRHKGLIKGLPTLTRSYWGMQMAHLGIAVCALGVVLSSQNSAERDLRLAPGESMDLAGYHFIFEGAKHFEGPNFTSDKGTIRVIRDGKEVSVLHPEKRLYTVQNSMMTEAGIDAGFTRDLYVALGEPLGDGAWAVRVHVKPFVRWIWFGGADRPGRLLAALDRRYRVKVKAGCVKPWACRERLHETLVDAVATGDFSGGGGFPVSRSVPGPGRAALGDDRQAVPGVFPAAVQGDKTLTQADISANRRWSTCGAPGAFPAGSSTRC